MHMLDIHGQSYMVVEWLYSSLNYFNKKNYTSSFTVNNTNLTKNIFLKAKSIEVKPIFFFKPNLDAIFIFRLIKKKYYYMQFFTLFSGLLGLMQDSVQLNLGQAHRMSIP